ncbi:MAG: hypothetical protein RLY93_19090, partial [Sumerlaeia bacterium]
MPTPSFTLWRCLPAALCFCAAGMPVARASEEGDKGFPGEFPPVRINFWDTTGHWGVVELDEFATDINLQRTWWANGVRYTSGNDI